MLPSRHRLGKRVPIYLPGLLASSGVLKTFPISDKALLANGKVGTQHTLLTASLMIGLLLRLWLLEGLKLDY